MKKFICILVALALCVGALPFAACGNNAKITITYNGNGGVATVSGEEVSSVKKTVSLGSSFVAPEFTNDGYSLVGWDKKVNDLTYDAEVNAIWQEIAQKEYTVTYDLNGGRFEQDADGNYVNNGGELSQIVKFGKDALQPDNPVRDGYIFLGWTSNGKNVTADAIIKAQWQAEKRYVAFSANGGEFLDASEGKIITLESENASSEASTDEPVTTEQIMIIEVDYGKAAVPPTARRDGYYILGYDSNDDGEIDADFGKITESWFDVEKYTDKDGKINFTNEIEFTTQPIKVIWAKNEGTASKHIVSFKSFTTHYGFIDQDKDGNPVDVKWSETKVDHNQNAQLTSLRYTSYPYRIKAWLGDCKNVKQDRTLYALWEEIQFTMSFDLDGGTLDNAESINMAAGLTQYSGSAAVPGKISNVPVPVKKGYTFTGWVGKNAYSSSYNETLVDQVLDKKQPAVGSSDDEYYRWTSSVSFVAEWEVDTENPVEFTITFDGNGGVTENSESVVTKTYAIDDEIESVDFIKDGYELISWSMALEDLKQHCLATNNYALTVKAQWREIWYKQTDVKLDANGGTVGKYLGLFKQGKAVSSLPSPEKQATVEDTVCKFVCWYYEKPVNGVVKQIELKNGAIWTENLKSVTLIAKWYEGVPETEITFDVYGNMAGLGGDQGYNYIKNADKFDGLKNTFKAVTAIPANIPAPVLEFDGEVMYEFLYWYYLDDGGNEIEVKSGELWLVNKKELTLLPKWKGPASSNPDGPFTGNTETTNITE